jgi:uncharacterized RDD family membrane protein YckC
MRYAGFWLRFVAFVIDAMVITGCNFVVNPGYMGMVRYQYSYHNLEYSENMFAEMSLFRVTIIAVIIRWLYFTLLESSKWQATVGKKLLGLQVIDENGNCIGFGRANARYWSKIISAIILCIGFIMAGFTEKKQALHDIIAKTLVVRR